MVYSSCIFINDFNIWQDFISFDQFRERYDVNSNYLEYFGLINAIPQNWKDIIRNVENLDGIKNKTVQKIIIQSLVNISIYFSWPQLWKNPALLGHIFTETAKMH